MQRKRTLLTLRCFKKNLRRIVFKFSAKRVLCALEYIFNKVNRGIVQKLDAVETLKWPGR